MLDEQPRFKFAFMFDKPVTFDLSLAESTVDGEMLEHTKMMGGLWALMLKHLHCNLDICDKTFRTIRTYLERQICGPLGTKSRLFEVQKLVLSTSGPMD